MTSEGKEKFKTSQREKKNKKPHTLDLGFSCASQCAYTHTHTHNEPRSTTVERTTVLANKYTKVGKSSFTVFTWNMLP